MTPGRHAELDELIRQLVEVEGILSHTFGSKALSEEEALYIRASAEAHGLGVTKYAGALMVGDKETLANLRRVSV